MLIMYLFLSITSIIKDSLAVITLHTSIEILLWSFSTTPKLFNFPTTIPKVWRFLCCLVLKVLMKLVPNCHPILMKICMEGFNRSILLLLSEECSNMLSQRDCMMWLWTALGKFLHSNFTWVISAISSLTLTFCHRLIHSQ